MAITRTQKLYRITLDWGTKKEVFQAWGDSPAGAAVDAMNSAGYGGGAIRALKAWDYEEAPEQ